MNNTSVTAALTPPSVNLKVTELLLNFIYRCAVVELFIPLFWQNSSDGDTRILFLHKLSPNSMKSKNNVVGH